MDGNATNVDEYLTGLPEWQRGNLSVFREIIHELIPGVDEQIKWGVPTFLDGKTMLFAMSAFKAHTKYNFIHNGAQLDDIDGLFNNGLESKTARAIDVREDDTVDREKLARLVRASLTAAGQL